MREFGVTEYRLNLLEQRDKDPLFAIRIGNRVWYSRAQLLEVLGMPTNPTPRPRLKRRHNGDGVTGG